MVGVLIAVGGAAMWAGDPLPARFGAAGPATMEVRGIDEAGRIRLRPVATDPAAAADAGEAWLPLAQVRDLQFVLPTDYRRAQQLAFAGRAGEAVRLLRRFVPALVPYATLEGSNAGAVVRFYLGLLMQERAWDQAVAVVEAVPLGDAARGDGPDFGGELVQLARVLQSLEQPAAAVRLLSRLPFDELDPIQRRRVEHIGDELRRAGHWREAGVVYENLRGAAEGDERRRLELLLAYIAWHHAGARQPVALLAEREAPPVESTSGTLQRLLVGRLMLAEGDATGALDGLAEALVGGPAVSEWQEELTAVMAAAYRADSRLEIADGIEADLRRLYPNSRWLPPTSPRPPADP